MHFALEVDWGSKIEQGFQDGYVSAVSAVLASPRCRVLCKALLSSVGRCPVKDYCRHVIPNNRASYETVGPDGRRVKVRICAARKLSHRRAAEVCAGDDTRRIKVMCYVAVVFNADLRHVRLMFACCGPPCDASLSLCPTQAQLEAAPAAAAASHHAQIINMVKADLCVNVKRILVATYFLDVSCRSLADPTRGGPQCSPILATTALPCWQQSQLHTKVGLQGRHELGELASVSDDTHRQRSETIFSTLYHLPLALILKPPARGPIRICKGVRSSARRRQIRSTRHVASRGQEKESPGSEAPEGPDEAIELAQPTHRVK